jgi:hypothetical protein
MPVWRNRKISSLSAQHRVAAGVSSLEGTIDSRSRAIDLLLSCGINSPFPVACVHQQRRLSNSFAVGLMP